MGAEHSQQRAEADGREIFDGSGTSGTMPAAAQSGVVKRRSMLRQSTGGSSGSSGGHCNPKLKQSADTVVSPTASEFSRPSSPPLSICSDLPYVSYTNDRPIGDSPKVRTKPGSALHSGSNSKSSAVARRTYSSGTKPKRPQSTSGSHNIVIVKPGTKDIDYEEESELQQLRNIPQFLPVLRDSVASATFTRDTEVLERLQTHPHLLNICTRMQSHLNICATVVATEQAHLVERTKVVSNAITTLFASFVDMQKTYAAYAEQFAKVRSISQQLSRCNSLLNDNIASLEGINNFLDVDDRLDPFVWRTDDNKLRSGAQGAVAKTTALHFRRL